ncbi:hypothetical protein GCM10025858_10820 [Alicyclobacillus sacchari]|uniref:lytic transglycosylase domain-containing protein n=1 Tax=Alicyclobacillus sacchari TaxID=392010 RepID=UPI0023E99DA3|nr:lytic transglycosylase domain-containing protein [Alicyclobacillus sacchari]GMA56579.1 hypothetical protein GCM10025858_10820 [Alicyclobacillus sacchari]
MERDSQGRRPRFIVLNRRSIIAAVLLVAVLVVISTNAFWRMMYPIHYQKNIQQAAASANVDPLLIASVIRVESKFHTQDVSHAGAVGLMQLMPQTAEWIAEMIRNQTTGSGAAVNRLPKDAKKLASPEYNILIGSWYVKSLIQQFQGNEVAAIAAYNAGPRRVSTWLKAACGTVSWMTSMRSPLARRGTLSIASFTIMNCTVRFMAAILHGRRSRRQIRRHPDKNLGEDNWRRMGHRRYAIYRRLARSEAWHKALRLSI